MSLTDEIALATKLKALDLPCKTLFDGVTTQAERREKVRVLVRQVPDVIFTVRNGREITMEMMFLTTYGDEL